MKNIYKTMPTGMKVCSAVCAVYMLGCLLGIAMIFMPVARAGVMLCLASLVNPMGLISAVVFIDDSIRQGEKLFPGKQKLYAMIGVAYALLATLCWFCVLRIIAML